MQVFIFIFIFYFSLWFLSGSGSTVNPQSAATEARKGRFPIWPEWNEADINIEKWDAGKGGKEKDKIGRSPILVSLVKAESDFFRFIITEESINTMSFKTYFYSIITE